MLDKARVEAQARAIIFHLVTSDKPIHVLSYDEEFNEAVIARVDELLAQR